jgi:hypothetical protein
MRRQVISRNDPLFIDKVGGQVTKRRDFQVSIFGSGDKRLAKIFRVSTLRGVFIFIFYPNFAERFGMRYFLLGS